MKKVFVVIVIFVILILGGLLWWNNGNYPVNLNDKTSMIFVVNKGQNVREIANRLKSQGLIKDPVLFFLLVKQMDLDKKIQAGSFRLSPSMTAREIAENLTHGTLDIWITVPEGKRALEVAQILKKSLDTYRDSWKDTLAVHEGYLFPDTYLIPKDANIDMIIFQMLDNFEKKYTALNTNNAKVKKAEIVILASLIEREAITDREKPIIAGIILNRLNAGIALQVDATIQYAKGNWKPVFIEEYKSVISNYNTYLHQGLPPTPISNPGLEALRAAAAPADTDYLYYLHDKNRIIRYAKTLPEHNSNIEKYGL